MQTITYYRFWCSHCKDFTIHRTTGDKSCKDCNTITESYKISEVPVEKLELQRKRYKEYKSNTNGIGAFLNVLKPENPFSEEFPIKIIEDDAGQKEIDNKKMFDNKVKKEKIEELKKEALKFKHLKRNAICLCGSGLKYKKCCLNKYINIL